MGKNLIKCLSFLLLTGIVIFAVYGVLSWKDTSGDYISVTKELEKTPKNSIDVVFLGSSHVYTSVYPAILYRDYGMSAFDMSLSEQDKDCSFYCLKELLRRQRPKVVCVEMYGLMFDGHSKIGDAYRNVLALKTSKNSLELAKKSGAKEDYLNYILRWPIVHTRYRELKKFDFIPSEIDKYNRGAIMGWGSEVGYMNSDIIKMTEETPLSDRNKEWIDSIYKLSKEYGFELVFFLAPDFQSAEEKMISNGARSYAKTLGIDYLDFTELADEMGFVPEFDMGDLVHCNADGAAKVTGYFGEYLSERYSLSDHRNDKRFRQWEEDYRQYRHIVQTRAIEGCEDYDEYFALLSTCEDLTVVLSLDGEYGNTDEFLFYFGIENTDMAKGKWIFKDGAGSKLLGDIPGGEVLYDVDRFDTFKLRCLNEGENPASSIMLGLDCLSETEDGLNIVVYDDFLKKVVDKRSISAQ